MPDVSIPILILGVFLAETAKNMAKGSATLLQQNVNAVLHDEIIALNLSADDTPKSIQDKFETQPKIQEAIRQKLEANPDLTEALKNYLDNHGRTINTKTYIENAGDITINQ